MMLLTAVAMPHRPVDRDLLRRTDWAGIVYAGVGFGLFYAGLVRSKNTAQSRADSSRKQVTQLPTETWLAAWRWCSRRSTSCG